jgi:hypothetical protein
MPWLLPPPARFASAIGATTKAAIKRPAIKPRCRTSIEFFLNKKSKL